MGRKGLTNLLVKGLSVTYDRKVLDELYLKLIEGEFVTIIGKSGCGKTTLLNAIAGFIQFEGDIIKPQRIGMVFQNFAVFPWLTVSGNIAFGLGRSSDTVKHYLTIIGLTDKKDKHPYELSGGEVQRVALARTLASDPKLILMDEPYGSLDIYTRDKMQKWLLEIWCKERKTVLFVTHSIEEAILLSDRVLVMNEGRIDREFPVNIKRPRTEESKSCIEFIKLRKQITKSLNGEKGRDYLL